tara:strand:+ start:81 stop:536 length:456 start_codon:yes stop_codon:yes gene_type:complete
MSTRSRIGILNQDGSVESVYHHSDGYPTWLGLVLTRHFSNTLLVRDLMKGGDISCIRSSTDWDRNKLDQPIILTYKMRGEDCPSRTHEDYKEFLMYDTIQTEYSYLWNPNLEQWTCWKANYDMEWMIPKPPTIELIPEKHPEEIRTNKVLV